MNKIPVSFKLDEKDYAGELVEVAGAGGGVWHLMVGGYYWGRLRAANNEWYFDESNWEVAHLKDHFAAVVIAWYQ